MKKLYCPRANVKTCDFYRDGQCRDTGDLCRHSTKNPEIAILAHLARILKNQEEIKQRLTALEQERTR